MGITGRLLAIIVFYFTNTPWFLLFRDRTAANVVGNRWINCSGAETMSDSDSRDVDRGEILRMAVEVVSSYVGRNQIAGDQIPELINTVYRSMAGLANPDGHKEQEASKPAVAVRRSVTPDYIICLEDGKKLKMLKRHLRTTYGMTPEEYRAKWKLPHDYPMVAPNYAKQRSEFAKNIGLGRKSSRPKSRKSA